MSGEKAIVVSSDASEFDRKRRARLLEMHAACPLPDGERLLNPGLYIERPVLSRLLYMDFLYRQIVDVPGVIMEFGVRWGQNQALFTNLRGIHEPFNYARKIVGFDTFSGFPSVHSKDGGHKAGEYAVTQGYREYLEELLILHEQGSPIPHKRKSELVVGDASQGVKDYLERNSGTVIAFAFFDFDLYEPTVACLRQIKDRLVKGSILAFDELNSPDFPGETLAVMEAVGLPNLRMRQSPNNPFSAYAVVE